MNLLQVADQLYSVKADFLNQHGLSNGRFTVLLLLSTSGAAPDGVVETMPSDPPGLTPAELAEMAGVTRATMSGLVDTLVKDGLVRREADTDDGRVMHVKLTVKAQSFVDDVLPGYFRRVAAIMAPLDSDDRENLKSLLGKVRSGIAAASRVDEPQSQTV